METDSGFRSLLLMHKRTLIREFRRKMESGFSLIEVMIAMSVLMVGVLGGVLVISVAAANNGQSKLHTTAVTLAASTNERILAIYLKDTGTATHAESTS